jgi:hypothetical protein
MGQATFPKASSIIPIPSRRDRLVWLLPPPKSCLLLTAARPSCHDPAFAAPLSGNGASPQGCAMLHPSARSPPLSVVALARVARSAGSCAGGVGGSHSESPTRVDSDHTSPAGRSCKPHSTSPAQLPPPARILARSASLQLANSKGHEEYKPMTSNS